MPNIVLVGYVEKGVAGELRFIERKIFQKVKEIIDKMGLSKDAIITGITSRTFFFPKPGVTGPAPYIIVRDTNPARAQKIATAINEQLNEDVEIEVLAGFLPKKVAE